MSENNKNNKGDFYFWDEMWNNEKDIKNEKNITKDSLEDPQNKLGI